eukprot:gene33658-17046_t
MQEIEEGKSFRHILRQKFAIDDEENGFGARSPG